MFKTIKNLLGKFSAELREDKIKDILMALSKGSSVLDIGVWCDLPEPNPSENWLEKRHKELRYGVLYVVGLDNMRDFASLYPNAICVQANGCALPFKKNSIDILLANAVLEHVPSDNHEIFIREMARVSFKTTLIAVPDRLCPIEIHSRTPFVHWLPFWRKILRLIGNKFWASEENLVEIFSKRQLKNLLIKANCNCGTWLVKRQFLGIIPVSLIALFSKNLRNDL